MGTKIIEVDGAGSREGSHARYSSGGAVFVIVFWTVLGFALGWYARGNP